jgi:hypothetical protein
MKGAVSVALAVCFVAHAIPVRAQNVAPATSWTVPARLVSRTGGGRLDEPKGVFVSDPAARQLRFESRLSEGE